MDSVLINGVEYKFDGCGVITRWFGYIIKKRKYVYVYVVDVPDLTSKIKVEASLPLKFLYFSKNDLIDNIPIIIYDDWYRLKKRFKIVKVINKDSFSRPAIRIGLRIKPGKNKLKKYCEVFQWLTNKTSIVPIDITDNYFEYVLYGCEGIGEPLIHDFACDDPKAMYIGLAFYSAMTGRPVKYMFDFRKRDTIVMFPTQTSHLN